MGNTIKSLMTIILIISGIVFISQCNTRHASEAETTVATDTTQADRLAPPVKAIQVPLTLIIENLKSATAPIIVSVYGVQDKFPDPHGQLKQYKFSPNGKNFTTQISGLKFGTYAIATYQDENNSGEIDKNLIGRPTEGFAFSNNFKPTVKAPSFDQCKFAYNAQENSVSMKMIQ